MQPLAVASPHEKLQSVVSVCNKTAERIGISPQKGKVMENKNYKVRCVGYNSGERYFTVGKVYDVVNGRITNDNGHTYQSYHVGGVLEYLSDWYKFERVEPANQKIVITTDGKTTLARLYDGKTVVKSAEAKCSPEDTFDFVTGATLAMSRLFTPKPEKQKEPEIRVGTIVKILPHNDHYHHLVDGQILPVKRTSISGDGVIEVEGYNEKGAFIPQTIYPKHYKVVRY